MYYDITIHFLFLWYYFSCIFTYVTLSVLGDSLPFVPVHLFYFSWLLKLFPQAVCYDHFFIYDLFGSVDLYFSFSVLVGNALMYLEGCSFL